MSSALDQLVDGHGRTISDLRISVTDRCNLRCTYCMPEKGLNWVPSSDILSYEEIERLANLFARMGVTSIRLTGGEPLVRSDLHRLVALLRDIRELKDISLTTNGTLLERRIDALVAAGIDRINVSLDTLDPERFEHITRRHGIERVIEGIEYAAKIPQLTPIKINVVALKGFTEQEVLPFVELARSTKLIVRFIEYMPLGADRNWLPQQVLSGEQIRSLIETKYELIPIEREQSATSLRYVCLDGKGEIGFINPVSNPFCFDCNRIRLTAEGMLRTCLFSQRETDLREPLREGVTDSELEQIIRDAVWKKELKHKINEEGFVQPARTMSQIGG